ncbi:MAG: FAD binding domain-containing protein [Anaerolineae bacterium]|nr:FAD binding domain-containing protein [Anaerolineae bacterium]MDW8070431.1 FAD binding domain-containing protein [Anaerolineae bacterium]
MAVQEYFLPQSLEQALDLLAEHAPALLVMAGGTIAMPLINEGISMPEKVMGLRRAGLDTVRRENSTLVVGATTTLTQLAHQTDIPMLQEAVRHIGGWQIRNMGTVGGNLFAPPPAGDLAVALLALDATVVLASKQRGQRALPLTEFFTGFMATALAPDELVTALHIPLPRGKMSYIKYGRRHANTPAIVTVAAHVVVEAGKVVDAHLALNAVGPHPIRARRAEQVLRGAPLNAATIAEAAREAAAECEPFTDAIATDWYRRRMTEVFVRRALERIMG